jgi:hypothetical protein
MAGASTTSVSGYSASRSPRIRVLRQELVEPSDTERAAAAYASAVFAPGPDRRPENVAFYGMLSEANLKCKYSGDAVHIDLDAVIVGERGPSAKGDSVDLPYFVAVAAPDQTILSKKPFAVHIAFDPNQKRAGVTDHIEETIPLGGRKGSDLNVVLGFQQSPEVVEFYRRFRGR